MSKVRYLIGVLILVLAGTIFLETRTNNLHDSSVMITNRKMNSGGTGIILHSTKHKSEVLTNNHVCKVVKDGGLVVTNFGTFQAASTKSSAVSDLCVLSVLDDLYLNTKVSKNSPAEYADVKISGHPALMPNIVSKGHLSGRAIIPVLTEMRPCTDQDAQDNPLLCAFFGGVPVVKFYESVLTSATIMPGSSGSGVYNSANNLVGVVFAGNSNFGYSWTVPYEQVKLFLDKELQTLPEVNISQEMSLGQAQVESKDMILQAYEKCSNPTNVTDNDVKKVCNMLQFDMVWRK